MKTILATGTIFLVTALFLGGIFYPTHPLMWFAATSPEYTALRALIIAALGLLLVTRPPRRMIVRAFMLSTALGLGLVGFSAFETFLIKSLDAFVLIEVAILLAIEGLELPVATETKKREKRSLREAGLRRWLFQG